MGRKGARITSLAAFLQNIEPTSSETGPIKSPGDEVIEPPSKKRKHDYVELSPARYEANGLVSRFTDESQVPEHLKKYFFQRERYFSLYSQGCLLDEEGWYSVTPEKMADQIAERCRCDCILDAFCGVGGNAIAFAKTCNRVIAMDISPTRLALARHNAMIYGVADRIEFILANYLDFARSYASRQPVHRKIDVVFLSPPWGGPSYLLGSPRKSTTTSKSPEEEEQVEVLNYSLSSIKPIPGDELFHLTRKITRNIAYLLPRNTNLEEISKLVAPGSGSTEGTDKEFIEIEEEYMSNKLKALTCYFGGLVEGQEDMFT